MSATSLPWPQAWQDAHLGPGGFYRHQRPERHFQTEAQSGLLAEALGAVIDDVDARLGRPRLLEVVDVGAGSGELLSALLDSPGHSSRWRLTGIDVRPRPADLPDAIEWIVGEAPGVLSEVWADGIVGVVLAHEWLDDLPVDVVACDADGVVREVLVEPATGVESPGEPVGADSEMHRWLRRWWWPVTDRAEVGLRRDRAWQAVCATVRAGTALAIDYGHLRADRERFAVGSIVGYRDGSTHWPIPDGSMNITAHVSVDSCASSTHPPGQVARQVDALRRLLPPVEVPDGGQRDLQSLARGNARGRLLARSEGVYWVRVDVDPVTDRADDRGISALYP